MIEAVSLSRSFGTVQAVRDVSFRVEPGEAVGFVGPNGAGKTTTFKMLTGSLGPTTGRIRIAGRDLKQHPLEAKSRVGYMPENAPLHPEMTAREYLSYRGELKGLFDKQKRKDAIGRWAKQTGISEVLGTRIGHLSKGFRQRVALTDALLSDPDVLLLDEPTAGLDPNQVLDVRQLIARLAEEKAILLSTHILSEVEATCHRAIVIHQGRVVGKGRLEDLKAARTSNRARLILENVSPDVVLDTLSAFRPIIENEAAQRGIVCDISISEKRSLNDAVDAVRQAGATLVEAFRKRAPLDEVFARLTGRDGTPTPAERSVSPRTSPPLPEKTDVASRETPQ